MTNILFIAYEFPPVKTAGVFRPLGFLENLRTFGYEPILITLSKKSIKKVYDSPIIDNELGNDIYEEFTVIEVDTKEINVGKKNKIQQFFRVFFSVTGKQGKGWEEDFYSKIDIAIGKYKPELIYVTAPPFSILKLTINLKNKYKIPLVIDMRDAWSNFFISPYPTFFHYFYTFKSERSILRSADAIIATSLQINSDFMRLHPEIEKAKFHYIPNGYNGELALWDYKAEKKDKISIGYVGAFYYNPVARKDMFTPWYKKRIHQIFQFKPNTQDWLYRSPYFFFESLFFLFRNYPEYKDKIIVKFAGQKPGWIDSMIDQFMLNDTIEFVGQISHKESMAFQREMDLLLITSSKVINGKDYSIAGKTFEYFKNQKPILAFVCDGAQKDILNKSGISLICNPDNSEQSAKKIKDFIDGNIDLKPNEELIKQHSRYHLTSKLAAVFNSLITV